MASEIKELSPNLQAILERQESTCDKAGETCAGKVSVRGSRPRDPGEGPASWDTIPSDDLGHPANWRVLIRLCEHHAQ